MQRQPQQQHKFLRRDRWLASLSTCLLLTSLLKALRLSEGDHPRALVSDHSSLRGGFEYLNSLSLMGGGGGVDREKARVNDVYSSESARR